MTAAVMHHRTVLVLLSAAAGLVAATTALAYLITALSQLTPGELALAGLLTLAAGAAVASGLGLLGPDDGEDR